MHICAVIIIQARVCNVIYGIEIFKNAVNSVVVGDFFAQYAKYIANSLIYNCRRSVTCYNNAAELTHDTNFILINFVSVVCSGLQIVGPQFRVLGYYL